MDIQIICGKWGDFPILHNSDSIERSPLKLLIFSFIILRGLWDLSSLTRDPIRPGILALECEALTTGLPRKS